jgi:uncharacterized protein
MPSFVYLHGFLSGPASTKARQTVAWWQTHFPDEPCFCPALSSSPREALSQLTELGQNTPDLCLIGSSLGGFWATWMVEQFGGRAVLINPAVAPHTRFQHLVGQSLPYYYDNRELQLTDADLTLLAEADCLHFKDPSRYWVLLQTGDEVLDYRDAQAHFAACQLTVEQGGDHSFQGYERHLPAIRQFLRKL